jgi:hypothetical protein
LAGRKVVLAAFRRASKDGIGTRVLGNLFEAVGFQVKE